MFSLECNFDQVQISAIANGVASPLWTGGCRRDGEFFISTKGSVESVTASFTSDVSITYSGFVIIYELVDGQVAVGSKTVPCPGPAICSNNGACISGDCLCLSGYTGEDCSNAVICPRDLASCGTSCDPICSESSNVIAVSMYGNDTQGTGEMMDTSQSGTAPKAVQSLQQALAIATVGQTVLIYPGIYKGVLNCDLLVTKQLTIRGLRGAAVTTIDCANAFHGVTISSAAGVKLVDFALLNTIGADGAAVKVVSSTATKLSGLHIIKAVATKNGGAVYASQSELTLQDAIVKNCFATFGGGGIYVDTVTLTLQNVEVGGCQAADGAGLYALGNTAVIGVSLATIANNTAGNRGGGLFFSTGTATVKQLNVRENSALIGGGVAFEFGSFVITSTNVSANIATHDGGGLAVLRDAELSVAGSRVRKNAALRNGGGVLVTTNKSLAFDSRSLLRENTAGMTSDFRSVCSCLLWFSFCKRD